MTFLIVVMKPPKILLSLLLLRFPEEEKTTAKQKQLVCIKKSEDAKIVPNLKFLKTRKEKRSKKVTK